MGLSVLFISERALLSSDENDPDRFLSLLHDENMRDCWKEAETEKKEKQWGR